MPRAHHATAAVGGQRRRVGGEVGSMLVQTELSLQVTFHSFFPPFLLPSFLMAAPAEFGSPQAGGGGVKSELQLQPIWQFAAMPDP